MAETTRPTMEDLQEQNKALKIRVRVLEEIAKQSAIDAINSKTDYECKIAELKEEHESNRRADAYALRQEFLRFINWCVSEFDFPRADVDFAVRDMEPLLAALPFDTREARICGSLCASDNQLLAVKFVGYEPHLQQSHHKKSYYASTLTFLKLLSGPPNARVIATLSEQLLPSQIVGKDWLREHPDDYGKAHLAYQLVLEYCKSDSPLIFWLCTNLALTLHLLCPFKNKQLWFEFLVAMLYGNTYDDLDPFSKAAWSKLISLSVDQDMSDDLMPPHAHVARFGVDYRDIHAIYHYLEYRKLADSEKLKHLQEHETPDDTKYTISKSGGDTITLVKAHGEKFCTALIQPPTLCKNGALWTLIWSPDHQITYDTTSGWLGKPTNAIEQIFPELAAKKKL